MKILLLPKKRNHIPDHKLVRLVRQLMEREAEVYAYTEFMPVLTAAADSITVPEGDFVPDIIMVLGGDGTVIKAARLASETNTPIVGINFGKVGYMTELEIDQTDLIDRVLDGDCRIESRMMIDVAVKRGGKLIHEKYPALNDVVLSNGPVAHLLSFDLWCDGALARSARGDGIIISTPTGSTAYSMSAGGPVIDPCLDCISATYICPYSFGVRSVIFGGGSVLEIKNIECRSRGVYLTIDGRDEIEILPGDEIMLTRSLKKTRFIRVKDDAFLGVLRQKLSEDKQ